MNTKTLIILFAFLVILVFGYLFGGRIIQQFQIGQRPYQQQPLPSVSRAPIKTPEITASPSVSITPVTPSATASPSDSPAPTSIKPTPSVSPAPMTSLPQALSPNASPEQRTVFAKLIHESAQEVNQMIINECVFFPLIARVKEGSSFSFINKDTNERRVRILDEYVIPGGQTKTITVQFKNGTGIYGIMCNSTKTVSGYLEIQPVK